MKLLILCTYVHVHVHGVYTHGVYTHIQYCKWPLYVRVHVQCTGMTD